MYRPTAFAVDDAPAVLRMLREEAFGQLVVAGAEGELHATPAPFIVDDALSTVRLHLARANPFWRAAEGRSVLLTVTGTHGYVSPRWYPTKAIDGRVVPTWNYEVVHLRATVRVVHDAAWLLQLVTELTDGHEAALGGPPWRVGDAPADHVAGMVRAIVGLELAVIAVEAKGKLSQNRPEADAAGAIEGLRAAGDPARARLASRMAEVLDQRRRQPAGGA
jgi:transcriptional regulator